MSRIEPGCSLDSKGMQPAEFINPMIIPQIYIDILQRNIDRVYGCLQIPQASSSWFCTTNSTEKVLSGHTTQCKTNLAESDCRQPLNKVIESVQVVMDGCAIDRTSSSFYCQPNITTKVNCSIQAPSVSSSQNLSLIVTLVVILIAASILLIGLFLWFRGRRKKKQDQEILSPSPVQGNHSTMTFLNSNPIANQPSPLIPSTSNRSTLNSPMYAVELGYAPSIPSPQINPSQAPKAVSTSIAPLIGDNDFNHIVDRSRKGLDPSQNDIDSHQIDFSTTLPHSNSTSTASLFLTNPPLPSLNVDSFLPSINGSIDSILPSQTHSPSLEVFPRPYRTFVNVETKAPDGPQKEGAIPFLHTSIISLPRQATKTPPADSFKCYALDWKLPLTAQYETPYANELIKPKVHFSDYSIAHLIASFQGFQVSIKEIIHASFMYSQQSNSPKLALKLFNTVTGLIPDEALGTLPHERAFLSKVIQIILSDVFLSMTSPMKLPSHMEFLKKEMKEIKADLKKNPTTQLLFCAFDHILTIKPSILLKYLHPLLAHASDSVVSVFQAHGLPPPDKKTMDNLLQIEMDWFIRLKREFPTVAFYVPNTESFVSKIITMDGGTGNKVAFVNCFGIWDLLVGEPGCLAKVWCKV